MKKEEREELTLTERQVEVLELLSQGWSNEAMAKTLFISISALRARITDLYVKFDLEGPSKYDKRLKLALIGKEIFG